MPNYTCTCSGTISVAMPTPGVLLYTCQSCGKKKQEPAKDVPASGQLNLDS